MKAEQVSVHTVGPSTQVFEAALLQHLQNSLGRDHDARRRLVKVSEQGISHPQRHMQGRFENFRELGVKGGRKLQFVAPAVATRCPTQWAFGGHMDGIRQELIELPAELLTGPLCEINT